MNFALFLLRYFWKVLPSDIAMDKKVQRTIKKMETYNLWEESQRISKIIDNNPLLKEKGKSPTEAQPPLQPQIQAHNKDNTVVKTHPLSL